MKKRERLGVVAAALFAVVAGCVGGEAKKEEERAAPKDARSVARPAPGGYRITGPYLHANLALFLVHGEDRLKGKEYLILQEALEQKKVVVHETGNVEELAIENVSAKECVYVQSGDIVKGGKQDRVITYDFVVPPESGRMPIASFCVEQGRWSRRGGELVDCFDNNFVVSLKELKLAAKYGNDQGKVWRNVAELQDKLNSNLSVSVIDPLSASSVQLTLENKDVQKAADEYVKKLAPIIEGKDDVLGYAFAINGELNSADVYASRALFVKLWPKLLNSSAVEAIAELKKGEESEAPMVEDVKAFFAEAEQGEATEKEISPRVRMITRRKGKDLLFETVDEAAREAPIHLNYVRE